MFYISRVNLGDRVVERINSGSNIEEVKAAVARINCGTVEAIRQATASEAALIEAGNHVTFIRQAGINP